MEMTPNVKQHQAYSIAFKYFNEFLFDNTLPEVMLTLTRDENAIKGYYLKEAWHDDKGNVLAEISLNANSMNDNVYFLLNVLIHEMVHLWQFTFGSPEKGSHNEEFAQKCEELGLVFEKDRTGPQVQTLIGPDGLAAFAVNSLPEAAIFPFMSQDKGTSSPPQWHPIPVPVPSESSPPEPPPAPPPPPEELRNNYACPICGLLAKAKPGSHLICGLCNEPLVEEVQK